MTYKVFFVEDEIITREGIRDNVDWRANGFELCGEATDGEMALPLLRTAQPDVLITDIKMPFMDGLQLSKIMRERMPWVKIIILSGHDEFEYAQQAIKLGVTDYLLKPITVQNLQTTLQKLNDQLDQERLEQERLKKLQAQVEENRATLRERLLFKLIVGAVTQDGIVEEGQMLGLDLVARYYLVSILKIELQDCTEQYEYDEFKQTQGEILSLIEINPDAYALKRDWGDLVLIMKGNTPEFLEEEREFLLAEINQTLEGTQFKVTIGNGEIKHQVTEICISFVEALAQIQNLVGETRTALNHDFEQAELLKLDKSAVENYLRCGAKDGCEEFFNRYLSPLGGAPLKSNLIKNYVFADVVLAIAKLVNDLGGDVEVVIPELHSMEVIMSNIKTVEQLKDQLCRMITSALAYRDGLPKGVNRELIHEVKEYLEQHYADPDVSLNRMAAHANLSPSHFSVVFGQEMGRTFKEYLTDIRINKAKELLRMTGLRSADIAYQVGYNDPHYFSAVFKKHTGLSPLDFRSQS